ncbi:MAG: helix-turn-helix domain-containing protein [Roseovarius sp.]
MANRKREVSHKGERTDHYEYLAMIRQAKLLRDEKLLLLHYANTHNWKEGKCSFWSERKICAAVSMSEKTFRKVRQSLVDLGWIAVHNNGDRQTPDIQLLIGNPNPLYEKKEWAKWWQPEGSSRVPLIVGNPISSDDTAGNSESNELSIGGIEDQDDESDREKRAA